MPMKGFNQTRTLDGTGGYTGSLNEYDINPANTTKIYNGDPVKLTAGYITVCAANEPVIGVLGGVSWYDPATAERKWMQHWDGVAGRQDVKAHVAWGSNMTFQAVWSGSVPAVTDIGTPVDIIYAAGNDTTGASNVTIGASAGGAGGQVFVLKLPELVFPEDNTVNAFDHATPVFEVALRLPQHLQ